jgi:hypothetical protein
MLNFINFISTTTGDGRTIVLAGHRTELKLILFIHCGVLIVETKRQNRTKPRSSTGDGYLDIGIAAIIFGLIY